MNSTPSLNSDKYFYLAQTEIDSNLNNINEKRYGLKKGEGAG